MKYTNNISMLILSAILMIFSACTDKSYETFIANDPVYLSYEELRKQVMESEARDIHTPGKIYFKDGYLFINEQMEGIHVIDLTNPSSPQKISFISIPGNVDIAIKENILYADSYVDLIALDVSDLDNISEVGRKEDIFPYILPEYDTDYPIARIDQEKGVVIDWKINKIRQEVEQNYYPIYYKTFAAESWDMASTNSGGVGGTSGTTFGVGGSMARFGLYDDYLYVVDQYNLNTFDISSMESPVSIGTTGIGWNVETMFIHDKHLFFGTQTGMIVYSLEVPEYPAYKSFYSHVTSCDPVVVQDDIAYVTLRGGSFCGGTTNSLDVVKMTDSYTKFQLQASYPMNGPYGLGIDDDILFVCDGDAGLKVYDASSPTAIDQNQISHFAGIHAFDVIPFNDYLFAIGEDGFYLYDYSDLQNIIQLASIQIVEQEN